MARSIAFDITHLASRLPVNSPTGIDKVDLAFAHHFATSDLHACVHYGFRRARIHGGERLRALHDLATGTRWQSVAADHDPAYAVVRKKLTNQTVAAGDVAAPTPSKSLAQDSWHRRRQQIAWRLSSGSQTLADNAIYLNVAQHAFEYDMFFKWLSARPDVMATFLVHDLLPLDYPEYFPPGYLSLFRRRTATILTYAKALITTSDAVAERLRSQFKTDGRPMVPLHVEPLPSSLPPTRPRPDPALGAAPYFVVLGTIEPRKNHMLLLNLWRRFAEELPAPPKLVVVGSRGWENEQVLDLLDRSPLIRQNVIECTNLGDHALVHLLHNARGLLMPSFAEGYGLPVIEALSLGTPVIASDIPVFREVSQGCALFAHPLDGPNWSRLIQALNDPASPVALAARADTDKFVAPDWPGYFKGITEFLTQL